MIGRLAVSLAVVTAALAASQPAAARDKIHIVGSSTVFPFATTVAERFGKQNQAGAPVVESTGTGGGMKLFCSGVGDNTPDISNASRRITASEFEACTKNGVSIAEITIGFDGIVLVSAKDAPAMSMTREQLWRAVAQTVPVNGQFVPNPYKKWSDISPDLPAVDILVYGPAHNHGTRDAWVELVMDPGCRANPEIKALDAATQKKTCDPVREDGRWVEISGDYAVVIERIAKTPGATAVITYSYLDQNASRLQGAKVDGVVASFDNIATSKYPLARPLFFYVKREHASLVRGLKEFVAEFVSAKAIGDDGYLSQKGLIPLPAEQLKKVRAVAADLTKLETLK